tara:strand:+ start:1936 stop:2106 length:171 start_codon:yes stop_codon:yes gene_type:complete
MESEIFVTTALINGQPGRLGSNRLRDGLLRSLTRMVSPSGRRKTTHLPELLAPTQN